MKRYFLLCLLPLWVLFPLSSCFEGDEPLDDPEIVANDSLGVLPGRFSVSATKQVRFSKGNLQYRASDKVWRFAENQYDVVGEDNGRVSADNTGWIDLFGWGTSGWDSGAEAYQPYSIQKYNSRYCPGNSSLANLYGAYANADWGVYNAISNGGNRKEMWRTLTKEEWVYLFYKRDNAPSLRTRALVEGVSGYLLLPDDWNGSSVSDAAKFDTYCYSASQWRIMESEGAVFLPCAGRRVEDLALPVSKGYYWSSSCDVGDAYCLYFYDDYTNPSYSCYRYYGLSVRLVYE